MKISELNPSQVLSIGPALIELDIPTFFMGLAPKIRRHFLLSYIMTPTLTVNMNSCNFFFPEVEHHENHIVSARLTLNFQLMEC